MRYHEPVSLSEDVCRRIAEEFKPEKIILFGSHAYGQPTPESDLDLLVVMPYEGSYFLQAMTIRRRLGLVTPMDLLVRTQEELQYRLDIGDRFMREIVERGKVMHEATWSRQAYTSAIQFSQSEVRL